jgi:hypothetical protein
MLLLIGMLLLVGEPPSEVLRMLLLVLVGMLLLVGEPQRGPPVDCAFGTLRLRGTWLRRTRQKSNHSSHKQKILEIASAYLTSPNYIQYDSIRNVLVHPMQTV